MSGFAAAKITYKQNFLNLSKFVLVFISIVGKMFYTILNKYF